MAYFLRISHYSKGDYLQIYFSFRDPETKKSKSKWIKTFGYESDLLLAGISDPKTYVKKEVDRLNEEWKNETQKVKTISNISPERHLGFLPLQKITEKLDVKEPLLYLNRAASFDFFECMMFLTYARAVYPCSKKKTAQRIIPTLYNAPTFSYDQILKCLDFVGSRYDKIIEVFTRGVQEAYVLDSSSVFFDCTNFYFEIDQEDDIRRKGPSKEHRMDPILGMGLLLDNNCIPIGMHLYPGNCSETQEIREIITRLKTQQNIRGKTIQVADKGLNSAENILKAIEGGDGYLFSKSIKKLSEIDREWAISDKEFEDIFDKDNKTVKFRFKKRIVLTEYKYRDSNGRIHRVTNIPELQIVSFNPKLAKKQRLEIKKMVNKAQSMCLSQAKRSEFGEAGKFIEFKPSIETEDQKMIAQVNEEKVEEALKLAGFNMLITSEIEMNPLDCYAKYHELTKIEETFKTMKSELNARPVYLQKKERIYGHFCICYLAVLLIRIFQYKTLHNQFSTEQVCEFIRGFKIFPVNKHLSYNLSISTELMEYIQKEFKIPVMNYKLSSSDIEKILNRSF